MNLKSLIVILAAVFLTMLAFTGIAYAQEKTIGIPEKTKVPMPMCCIAGTYDGTSVDDPKCPVGPKTGNFVMVINQEPKCGSRIRGEIGEATGVTTRFEGTVMPGSLGCCIINGTAKGMPGTKNEGCVHRVEATICKESDGKYAGKGNYKSIGTRVCCDGTFKMRQR